MRKMYFIAMMMFAALTSCEKSNPEYSIDGRWIWSPSENRADANTMFEFEDGNVYTYYCLTCPADDDYWNSLGPSDRIPGVDSYTFDGDTLIWSGIARVVTFECEGGKLYLDGTFTRLWRVSSNCQ